MIGDRDDAVETKDVSASEFSGADESASRHTIDDAEFDELCCDDDVGVADDAAGAEVVGSSCISRRINLLGTTR